CIFQRIRQHGEPCQVEGSVWERTLFVGALGEADNRPVIPGQHSWPDSVRSSEWITEKVMNNTGLASSLYAQCLSLSLWHDIHSRRPPPASRFRTWGSISRPLSYHPIASSRTQFMAIRTSAPPFPHVFPERIPCWSVGRL